MTAEPGEPARSRPSWPGRLLRLGRQVGTYAGLLVVFGLGLGLVEQLAQLLGFSGDGRQIVRLVLLLFYGVVVISLSVRRRA